MRFPIPVFLFSLIIFTAVLAVKRQKHTAKQEQANESFLERERQANATRKKDISNLDYLTFTSKRLPIAEYADGKLQEYEAVLTNLSNQKIINLSQYSNTDLKLMYGPANFNDLSEFDENYHMLADTLFAYAKRQSKLERTDAAISILEYAMELKIDSSQIYLLLAKLYHAQNTPEKIQLIIDTVSSMDESFAFLVLPKLNASHTAG